VPRRLMRVRPFPAWLMVSTFCAIGVLTRTWLLIAVGGIAIALWSLALATNWQGWIDNLQRTGQRDPNFDLPTSTYRRIGQSGLLLGLVWTVLATLESFR
jgi:hypothetical protein